MKLFRIINEIFRKTLGEFCESPKRICREKKSGENFLEGTLVNIPGSTLKSSKSFPLRANFGIPLGWNLGGTAWRILERNSSKPLGRNKSRKQNSRRNHGKVCSKILCKNLKKKKLWLKSVKEFNKVFWIEFWKRP